MTLQELEDSPEHTLVASTTLHRVQRLSARAGAVVIGALKLPPRAAMAGRFDLPNLDVGYFADGAVTAVYETLARRDAMTLSVSGAIALRQLLTMRTTQPLRLLDVRGKAHDWPVLQSLRYGVTQALAAAAKTAGFEGVIYRSAQRHDAECYALFGAAPLASLRLLAAVPLALAPASPSGTYRLHRAVADAIRGSQVVLTP